VPRKCRVRYLWITVLLRPNVQSCDKIWTQKKSEKSKEKHFGWGIFLAMTGDWTLGRNSTVHPSRNLRQIYVDHNVGPVAYLIFLRTCEITNYLHRYASASTGHIVLGSFLLLTPQLSDQVRNSIPTIMVATAGNVSTWHILEQKEKTSLRPHSNSAMHQDFWMRHSEKTV